MSYGSDLPIKKWAWHNLHILLKLPHISGDNSVTRNTPLK